MPVSLCVSLCRLNGQAEISWSVVDQEASGSVLLAGGAPFVGRFGACPLAEFVRLHLGGGCVRTTTATDVGDNEASGSSSWRTSEAAGGEQCAAACLEESACTGFEVHQQSGISFASHSHDTRMRVWIGLAWPFELSRENLQND
eukprot:COSAG06_NODE_10595_length_1652_cov_1.153252_2_plen_144_part_00